MEKFLEIIKSSKRILITSHESPDPDAVGSILSMYFIFKQLGFENLELGLETPHSISNKFLPEIDLIKIGDLKNQILRNDLIIVVDANRSDRLIRDGFEMFENKKIIVLDHHDTETNLKTEFYKRFDNTSNCEGLYEMFEGNIKLEQKLAKSLLLGIYGDTGGFKYKGINSTTLNIASNLMDAGADLTQISQEVDKVSEKILKISSIFFSNLTIGNNYFASFINEDEVVRSDATYLDITNAKDSTINTMLNLENVIWGFVIKPKENGDVSVSFRSKNEKYNVAKLAEVFGGGGHILTSGCTIKSTSVNQALDNILNTLKTYKW